MTWRWKALKESDKIASNLIPIGGPNRRSEQEVMDAQSPESPNRDNFGTPPWESREKVPFGCGLGGELQRIL